MSCMAACARASVCIYNDRANRVRRKLGVRALARSARSSSCRRRRGRRSRLGLAWLCGPTTTASALVRAPVLFCMIYIMILCPAQQILCVSEQRACVRAECERTGSGYAAAICRMRLLVVAGARVVAYPNERASSK